MSERKEATRFVANEEWWPSARRVPMRTLRELPKVCLHDHLDGALRPATILELAEQVGHRLPEQTPEALGAWFRESADSGSLERYLETFEHTVAVLQTAEALRRAAREYVEDIVEDGVIYAEVRWAPEQHTERGLSMEEAVAAVAEGLAEGTQAAKDAGSWVSVRQLLCALRHRDRSLEVAQLAVASKELGVVGFDLAGPEDGYPASMHRKALEYCAENYLPTTIHAGEAAGLDSIKSALMDGRARRLGHGVRIWEDVTYAPNEKGKLTYQPGPLAAWIRDREIGLEMCPCSNLQTGALPETPYHRHHPVAMLNEMGFCVCVSPDNRLMSGTSMTHEYRMIAESFGYNESEFVGLATTAALQAFLPAREKDDLVAMIGEVYYQHLEKEKARQAEKKAAREAAAAAEKAAVEAAPEPASEPAAVEPAAAEPAEGAAPEGAR